MSGYYTLPASNGSLISVYCDMEGQCDGKGGWLRVGYINKGFFKPWHVRRCTTGIEITVQVDKNVNNFENINYKLCDRPHPSSGG